MRTIRFRGKRIDNGEWVYGSLVITDYGHYIIPSGINLMKTGCGMYERVVNPVYKVDSKTVGQFTGLKDKTGREMYEGDILTRTSWMCVVKFGCYTEDDRDHLGFYLDWINESGLSPAFADWCDCKTNTAHFTIIGNIHDNKEMLK